MTFTSDSWPSPGEGVGFPPLATSSAFWLLPKTSHFPSGDQLIPPAPRGSDVICHDSPPDIASIKTCGPLSSPRTNARYLPSGDQRGVASRVLLVRRCGSSSRIVDTAQI